MVRKNMGYPDIERARDGQAALRRIIEAYAGPGADLRALRRVVDLCREVQAARNALELSTLRYESGYSPYLEVLDAQRTANDAELAYVRNRQARLAFSVDLMKALGGGWNPAQKNAGSGS